MKKRYILLFGFLSLLVQAQNPVTPEIAFRTPLNMLTDSRVRGFAIQPDGKIIMIGSFKWDEGSTLPLGIIRLNPDGTRDTSFNVGAGIDSWGAFPAKVKLQPDGKIVVIGDFETFNGVARKNILRLNSDGTLDAGFNVGTGFDYSPFALEIQTDGKILVGGMFYNYNGSPASFIVRLNADGTRDNSFQMGTGFSSMVSAIRLQPDGKILVAGEFSMYNEGFATRMTRLNSDGTRDTTFNQFTGTNTNISVIEVQPDGKILIAGSFTYLNGSSNPRNLARLNSDGSTESSLMSNHFYDGGGISSLVLKPNGKILIAGGFSSSSFSTDIQMLNNDFTKDISFTASPGFYNAIGDGIHAVAIQPDGKILVGGYFDRYNENFSLGSYVRLLGTEYFTLRGNVRLDMNANGCDANDVAFPFPKFQVTNGATTNTFIGGMNGFHESLLKNGTNVITPVLDNPDYFAITPASVTVSYPGAVTPHYEDFCVTPVGSHTDVTVRMLPLNPGIPGFTANYKVIYSNKGNQTANGNVTLSFDDAALNLTASNPAVSVQSENLLSWNYTNLQPFETREILVSFLLNTPGQTPALNSDDVLSYTATVSSVQIDEMPIDNTYDMNQVLANSLDPNDKTCLQGNVVSPEMAGQYVDYMIRFENTGTYAAQNVSIKDVIDLSKFDINSLRPVSGSHPFITRIMNNNNVEFYFENINLPFDDANNDGYVAFRIKTLPTLVNGDSFSNTASIFFDYNLPIVTNTATTLIQNLGTPEQDFSNYFSISPNPVNGSLNVKMKQSSAMHSMSVYNMLGQLVAVFTGNVGSADVSSLKTGTYIVKIKTDKGSMSQRFIKN